MKQTNKINTKIHFRIMLYTHTFSKLLTYSTYSAVRFLITQGGDMVLADTKTEAWNFADS